MTPAGIAAKVDPRVHPVSENEWRYLHNLRDLHGAQIKDMGQGSSRKHIQIRNADRLFDLKALEQDSLVKTEQCEGCEPGVRNTVSVWVNEPSELNLDSHHLKDAVTLLRRYRL